MFLCPESEGGGERSLPRQYLEDREVEMVRWVKVLPAKTWGPEWWKEPTAARSTIPPTTAGTSTSFYHKHII